MNLGSDNKDHLGLSINNLHPISVEQEKGRTRVNPNSKQYFKIQISSVSKNVKYKYWNQLNLGDRKMNNKCR